MQTEENVKTLILSKLDEKEIKDTVNDFIDDKIERILENQSLGQDECILAIETAQMDIFDLNTAFEVMIEATADKVLKDNPALDRESVLFCLWKRTEDIHDSIATNRLISKEIYHKLEEQV